MSYNDIIALAHRSISISGNFNTSAIAHETNVSESTVRKVLRMADREGDLNRTCTTKLGNGRRCGAPLPREAWGRLGTTCCALHTRLDGVKSGAVSVATTIAAAGTGEAVAPTRPLYAAGKVAFTPEDIGAVRAKLDAAVPFEPDAPIPYRPTTPAMPEELATALDGLTVEVVEGEPRASAFQLAELLGFARPRKIKDLIDRNREELEVLGEIPCRPTVGRQATGFGEREYTVDVPWLNRTQCLIVTMKANTADAAEARVKIAKSFEREQDRAAKGEAGPHDLAALTMAVANLTSTVAEIVSRIGVPAPATAPQPRPAHASTASTNQLLLSPAFSIQASAEAKGDRLSVSDIAARVGLPMDDRRESSKRLVTTWLQETGLWRSPSVAKNIRLGMVAGGRASERDHWVYAPSILEGADATVLRQAAAEVLSRPSMSTKRAFEIARAVIKVAFNRRAS